MYISHIHIYIYIYMIYTLDSSTVVGALLNFQRYLIPLGLACKEQDSFSLLRLDVYSIPMAPDT